MSGLLKGARALFSINAIKDDLRVDCTRPTKVDLSFFRYPATGRKKKRPTAMPNDRFVSRCVLSNLICSKTFKVKWTRYPGLTHVPVRGTCVRGRIDVRRNSLLDTRLPVNVSCEQSLLKWSVLSLVHHKCEGRELVVSLRRQPCIIEEKEKL